MDEIQALKDKVQILHERLLIVESSIRDNDLFTIRQLQNDISNLKIVLLDIKKTTSER